jgi:hypothetical protein
MGKVSRRTPEEIEARNEALIRSFVLANRLHIRWLQRPLFWCFVLATKVTWPRVKTTIFVFGALGAGTLGFVEALQKILGWTGHLPCK